MSNLKKALYTLLHDQFETATDLEVDSYDGIYVDYIVSALIEKNGLTCPYKNYSSTRHCKSNTEKCKEGLKITCGIEEEEVWKNFMDINLNGQIYGELPSRGKVASDGEKARNCVCGGRCYVSYDEEKLYRVDCERCGILTAFRASSLDRAIKIWNDIMPTAIGA